LGEPGLRQLVLGDVLGSPSGHRAVGPGYELTAALDPANAPAGEHEPVLVLVRLSVLAQLLDDAEEIVSVVGVDDLEHPAERGRTVGRIEPEDPERLFGPAQRIVGPVPPPVADLADALRFGETRPACGEFVLGLLALADVLDLADEMNGRSV